MDIPALIQAYGYAAIFIGAFLEGETVLALGGFAAFRGHLELWIVIVVALLAGFLGDQFYFFLGRLKGKDILARRPQWESKVHRFDELLSRYHAPLIIGIRFMYGFRIIGPILLGMGRVERWKFVVYNFIGACIWAPLIAGLGYLFGQAVEVLLQDIKEFEIAAMVVIVLISLATWLVWRYRQRRKERSDISGQS
jgi:membrane protein DedA with SNARE-associated domain